MKNKKQIFQNSPEFEVEKRRIITLDKLLNKGDFSTVIKEGKKYMKDHVELPFVHTAVSLAYIKKNRIKAALKILNEIVKRFPDFSEVHFYLGIAYDQLNSPDSALGFYNRALSSPIQLEAKQYSDCLVRIGVIKLLKMEFAEALKFWERALKADPSNDEAKENKRIVLDSLRDIYDISGKMNIRELAEGADNAARIESLLNEKNDLAAITEAKKCIDKGTKIPKIYWLISHAYINTEQYEEARKILHEGENKFPEYSDFYYNLAEAYSGLNHTDSAIKYYALAAENEDSSDKKSVSHCLTKLGEQKGLKGENEEALLLWKKALQLNPKNKFARTCILIHKKGSLMPDMDKLKNTLDLHREFQKIQTAVYLNNNNLKKFSSDEEKKKVLSKIGSAWKSEIIPNIDIIEKLPEAGRREWFERIKIDFLNEYIFRTSADQILYEKEVNARFPYLPENGILHVYTARPALSFKGIPEDKLLNFMSGTEKPNKKEIELIRWAYEIGYRYNNQKKFQGKKFKEHIDGLSEFISKKFREKSDAGLILYKMLENNLMNR